MKLPKSLELLLIFMYIVIATVFIVSFQLNFLETVVVYFGIPSIYFSIRQPKIITKTLIVCLTLIVPLIFMLDYMAHVSEAWYVPSILGLRIMGVFPIDEFIWGTIYVYFIISLYEYLFDTDRAKRRFSSRSGFFYLLISSLLTVFGIICLIQPELLVFYNFYIFFILIGFLLPTILVLRRYPKLLPRMMAIGTFLFAISVIYEVVANYLGHWLFPGDHYIAMVKILDQNFPMEEFLWLIFAVPAILCFYEYFIDDSK